jgi:hypothetical protein
MYIKFIIKNIIIIINIMISFETYYYIFILLRNVMYVYIDMQCTYIPLIIILYHYDTSE